MKQLNKESSYEDLIDNYNNIRDKLTDKFIVKSVLMRKKDKSNESVLRACIAAYVCSDEEVKGMLEKELGKNDLAIRVGKDILRGVGKEIPEISSKTETQSKGNGYFTNKEKERREKNQDIKTLDLGGTKS